jgi:hypothetical protein
MRGIICGLALLTAGLAAPLALAGAPTKSPAPASDFTDTTTCGFPVDVHVTVNGQHAIAFEDGRVIVAGPLRAEFSANGKSVTLNISGPATITPTGGSVMIVGRGGGVGALLLPDGRVTLAYTAGVVTLDPSGGPGVLDHGTIRLDICSSLAP